jgi:hypothetical protein
MTGVAIARAAAPKSRNVTSTPRLDELGFIPHLVARIRPRAMPDRTMLRSTVMSARLVGLSADIAGQVFELSGETIIGRRLTCGVCLHHWSIAGSHARIRAVGDRYVLEDHNTANGSMVNGKRVQSAELAPGDVVQVGMVELRFELAS